MGLEVRVTDLETKKPKVYVYSKHNWRGEYACMRNGAVVCWTPKELESIRNSGGAIVTNGKRWELRRDDGAWGAKVK